MAGGVLAIVQPSNSSINAFNASLVGNTCLYGATGGKVFVNGRGGERFGVRNSATKAIVEGTGDHACEYMTGGVVVCLGTTGRNVGAGMTGGLAYFYDEDNTFPDKVGPGGLAGGLLLAEVAYAGTAGQVSLGKLCC